MKTFKQWLLNSFYRGHKFNAQGNMQQSQQKTNEPKVICNFADDYYNDQRCISVD